MKKQAWSRMERAEGDRKQLCESPAHYMRLEKSWRQDLYVYAFSDLLWESQDSCVWGWKGHRSPSAQFCSHHISALARGMKKLGFYCVRRY